MPQDDDKDDQGLDGDRLQGPGAGEDRKKRVDRELIELLNELRVALPGVQVRFAFLLTVPFSQRFGRLTALQKYVYFGTFVVLIVVLRHAPSGPRPRGGQPGLSEVAALLLLSFDGQVKLHQHVFVSEFEPVDLNVGHDRLRQLR